MKHKKQVIDILKNKLASILHSWIRLEFDDDHDNYDYDNEEERESCKELRILEQSGQETALFLRKVRLILLLLVWPEKNCRHTLG